jgi:hypothetical protein
MFVYLLIGLIVIMGCMWGYIDIFFNEITNSISLLSRKWPEVPEWFIKGIFSLVFILYWIGWPLFITYILYKAIQK